MSRKLLSSSQPRARNRLYARARGDTTVDLDARFAGRVRRELRETEYAQGEETLLAHSVKSLCGRKQYARELPELPGNLLPFQI
jgi:hypothetical protein